MWSTKLIKDKCLIDVRVVFRRKKSPGTLDLRRPNKEKIPHDLGTAKTIAVSQTIKKENIYKQHIS